MSELVVTSILDALSSPILVGQPILKDGKITDIQLVYQNEAFKKQVCYAIDGCTKLTQFIYRLNPSIPWMDIAEKTLNSINVDPITYYSDMSHNWFKMSMTSTPERLIVINLMNITKEKEQDQRLKETAFIDVLTGIANRNKFNEDFKDIISNAEDTSTKAALLLIDIDNMKNINDSKGHNEGDRILKSAVTVLKKFERKSIKSYRFGDDEFLVAIQNVNSLDSIVTITDTIFESFLIEGISVSGGITVFPDHTDNAEDLLRYTDIAIHYAKKDGKNRFEFFEPEMQICFIQKLNMQTKMSQAVLDSDFEQVYQPQFDIQTGQLRGFEALIRWHDEELGTIPPSVFIPLAEEIGLIIPIGKWIIRTAFATLKKWQTEFNFGGVISVNISPLQIKQDNFLAEIKDFLNEFNLDPDFIEIEITEGLMIDNIQDAIFKLDELKKIGFRISLDDFGTGYSSLSYLQALSLNTLKIDKSFINDITADDGIQANITNSIIEMVSKMGLDTIAEGVEHPEQLELLKKFNCHIVQGFLRGTPMPKANCEAYLAGDEKAIISIEMGTYIYN